MPCNQLIFNANLHPFGMGMPGRNSSSDAYRYGFNGKEKDDEVKGNGNSYDYGARIHDPRLGRFLSVDPIASSYPFYAPYQFAGNSPIQAIDLDGAEPEFIIDEQGKLTKPMMALFNAAFTYSMSRMQHTHWVKKNTRFNANTIYKTIRHGTRSNYLDKENPSFTSTTPWETWVDYWFNLSVHEHKHRNEYNSVSWFGWVILYGIDIGIHGYSENLTAEKRGYAMEHPMVSLANFQNSLALKALESDFDEPTKIGILTYVGTTWRLQNETNKLNSMIDEFFDGDLSNKQTKRLMRKIEAQQQLVSSLNATSEKLKEQYSEQIGALDKILSREIKFVNNPTKSKRELRKERKAAKQSRG